MHKEMENLYMHLVIFMMDNGIEIELMVLEHIKVLMVLFIRDNGFKINKMVMVLRFGMMGHNMKELIEMELKRVMEHTNGIMDQCIKVNGLKI
jgi:hypothetical protein